MTNKIQFIYKSDKEKIIKKLEYYGIKELPFLLVKSGNEKIRGYSGSLTTNEIIKINEVAGIDLVGLYLFHNYEGENNEDLRLSFDAVPILKNQITKNILELNEKQLIEFLKGSDIALSKEDKETWKNEPKGFKIIKFKHELLGTAKLTEDRIVNYMPKERRLK